MTHQEWLNADKELYLEKRRETIRHKTEMDVLYQRQQELDSIYVANRERWWAEERFTQPSPRRHEDFPV
jgi:hypothetical protein